MVEKLLNYLNMVKVYSELRSVSWFHGPKLEHTLAVVVIVGTLSVYTVFFVLGRRWRRMFEVERVEYWKAPKKERITELLKDIWEPKRMSALYGLAYFTNGYVRTAFSLWMPIFLLDTIGVSTIEAALFIGLMYFSWSWKMFMGIVSDGVPLRWRGRDYRRKPWFVVSGSLYVLGALIMSTKNLETVPVWTVTFPAVVAVLTAGAFYDMAADSYALDVTPPEYHARVLGGISTAGQSIGSALACVLPPLILKIGGFNLVLTMAALTGLTSFLFLTVNEPGLEHERVFSRRAVAFTFTERTVPIAALLMFARQFTPQKIVAPLGGMFTFAVKKVIGARPEMVGMLGLAATLTGLPGAILGGYTADKWGHKKMFIVSSMAFIGAGILWTTLEQASAVWFLIVAVLSSFIERFWTGTILTLMADATPLAIPSTVYQMYMSFVWIGNIPASVLMGFLLGFSLPLTATVTSALTCVVLLLGIIIKPYEAGKATKM